MNKQLEDIKAIRFDTTHEAMFREITLLITDASAVLLFSICFGIYFS